uniref:Beta-defensin 137 n=1 Tax=Garrulax canorus TaxID=238855 RepID=A0A3G1AYC3_9PASS|nr:beta-defensin 137 [Garrulax canorus]
MKILFLLFLLLLPLVQGSPGLYACWSKNGFCQFGRCRYPNRPVGKCSRSEWCCQR